MYDLDELLSNAFEQLFSSTLGLARCSATWHVSARGTVYDSKYHAGASHVVNKTRIHVNERNPPHVKTNVTVLCIPVGKTSLYLLPDRILVWSREGVGALAYTDLEIDIKETMFIEDAHVPRDARVVDKTWQYVNKKGRPDRRFSNNRELPVCLYEQLHLSSMSGLNEIIQLSATGRGAELKESVKLLATAIEGARVAELQRQQIETQRQQQVVAQREISSEPRKYTSGKAISDSTPTFEMACDALIEILCSVMAADGRVSRSERSCVTDLMGKVKSHFTTAQVEARIDSFIDSVSSIGYKRVLSQSLSKVALFKAIGREEVLLRCIDILAGADSKLDDRERALCEQIKQMARA